MLEEHIKIIFNEVSYNNLHFLSHDFNQVILLASGVKDS